MTGGHILQSLVFIALIGSIFVPYASAGSASQLPSPEILVYTSLNGTDQYLYLPPNSTGLNAYPDWHISIFCPQAFELYVDGNLTEKGIGPISLDKYFFNSGNVSLTVDVGNVVYTFLNETILESQPSVNVQSVSAVSSYRGQNQELTATPGESGQLMYANWTITMRSGSNETYVIYEGSREVASGYVLGSASVSLNVSSGPVTVTVGLGSKTYVFRNELIATVPLTQYYSPPKPALVATALDVVYAVGIGVIVFAVWIIVAGTTFRRWIMDRMKRRPRSR